MSAGSPIRVLIADDHHVVRRGLMTALLAFDDIEVVGEAATGAEALRMCVELQPDVVVMDLIMPEMSGVETIKRIHQRQPQVKVMVLTSFKEKELIESALKAGAIGYLLKDVLLDELGDAIRTVYAGKPAFAPEATQTLLTAFTRPEPPGQNLTRREQDVLALMVKGLNNPQIAGRLGVSRSTVNTHVSNILSKLEVANRLEAVALALEHNLVR